jgi:hypothetical protein
VRIGKPWPRIDDLLAHPGGLRQFAATVELAGHFNRLDRRNIHAAMQGFVDRIVDIARMSDAPLSLRISCTGRSASMIRGAALGASLCGGLGRAGGFAVGHGFSFTRKCQQIKGLGPQKLQITP